MREDIKNPKNETEQEQEYHFCKYCGEKAPGSYEDLLCEGCRELFGHSLYSEL